MSPASGRLPRTNEKCVGNPPRLRQAWRQHQGFRELDIALREDGRLLEDLKHRIPYQDRPPVQEVAREVDELRDQVLKALFPLERPRKKSSAPAPHRLPMFSMEIV